MYCYNIWRCNHLKHGVRVYLMSSVAWQVHSFMNICLYFHLLNKINRDTKKKLRHYLVMFLKYFYPFWLIWERNWEKVYKSWGMLWFLLVQMPSWKIMFLKYVNFFVPIITTKYVCLTKYPTFLVAERYHIVNV